MTNMKILMWPRSYAVFDWAKRSFDVLVQDPQDIVGKWIHSRKLEILFSSESQTEWVS